MRELTVDGLIRLTCAALERTCFMMAQPADETTESTAPLPAATRFSSIVYTGPETGSVHLAASDGLARNLAASLLGESPETIDAACADDALRELSNIIAGSLICELGGARCPFVLGLPASAPHLTLSTGERTVAILDAEGERLEVHWERHVASMAA